MSENRIIKHVSKDYPDLPGQPPGRVKLVKYTQPYQLTARENNQVINVKTKEQIKFHARRKIAELKDQRNLRRSKTTVKDIVLSNHLPLYATFTFDPKKVKRQDPTVCKMKMSGWLDSMRRKYGRMQYVIVPERHKDGALHFHALIGGYMGVLTKKPFDRNGRPQFELTDYNLGWSQAQIIPTAEDYAKVANYVTKYITKDMPHFAGKKRFWCSKYLQRPIKSINDVRFDDIEKDCATFDKSTRYIVRRMINITIIVTYSCAAHVFSPGCLSFLCIRPALPSGRANFPPARMFIIFSAGCR